VKSTQSLYRLAIGLGNGRFPRDPSGLIALADTLRAYTTLREFTWVDRMEAVQDLSPDVVLQALPACIHLQKVRNKTRCASTDVMQNLLHLHEDTALLLALTLDHWMEVVDEIRQGSCNIRSLTLSFLRYATRSEAMEAVKSLASAIQMDRNLTYLCLQMEVGFTDKAGVALAEALMVNKTLRMLKVSATQGDRIVHK
jgi:hypothetical protein